MQRSPSGHWRVPPVKPFSLPNFENRTTSSPSKLAHRVFGMTSSEGERPKNPRQVQYPPPRAAIVRSAGETPSERYLAQLADRSFLRLWSYPNTFIDKKRVGRATVRSFATCSWCAETTSSFSATSRLRGPMIRIWACVETLGKARNCKVRCPDTWCPTVDQPIPRSHLPRSPMHAKTPHRPT